MATINLVGVVDGGTVVEIVPPPSESWAYSSLLWRAAWANGILTDVVRSTRQRATSR